MTLVHAVIAHSAAVHSAAVHSAAVYSAALHSAAVYSAAVLSSYLLSGCPLSSCSLSSCSPDVTCCCCFQLEELPKARERISALEQRNENLEAVVKMKQDYERYVTSHGKPCSALTLHSRAPLPGRGG